MKKKTVDLNCDEISYFYCIFDQINAALNIKTMILLTLHFWLTALLSPYKCILMHLD